MVVMVAMTRTMMTTMPPGPIPRHELSMFLRSTRATTIGTKISTETH